MKFLTYGVLIILLIGTICTAQELENGLIEIPEIIKAMKQYCNNINKKMKKPQSEEELEIQPEVLLEKLGQALEQRLKKKLNKNSEE